jgi:sigma-B regulation protein RsbU (phosphoserine phosphatase)
MDWYQIPKLLKKPCWSEPYFDEGGADVLMTTYSIPLYDAQGKMFAVFTADISLEWFAEKINEIKAYPHSHNRMIGRGGTFLVHERKEAILNESFFAKPLLEGDSEMMEVGHRMVNGERGFVSFDRNNEEYYLFYAPVKSTGWSVSVSCLYSDVFAGVYGLLNKVVFVFLLGLLLLISFCYYTVHRLSRPLERFAGSADEIAKGNFNAMLPMIKSEDEMKTLHDSFESMQRSLVNYIDELKRTTASKERIESELRIARDIQMGMVPKLFPDRDDLNLSAKLIPAKEVGGDLYDFFIEGNKFFFIVGDVSGKGIPASLVMAVTCRLFRTVASHFDTPAAIMTALNDTLAENNESNMFCTAFLGVLNLQTGVMQYCNAGHNAPVLMHKEGKVEYMEVLPNLPLGLFGSFPYEGQECVLNEGDSLFLYTDGVTEAENVAKELYSDECLLAFLAGCHQEEPAVIVEKVYDDIERHTLGAEQSDDITMMCVNYK